jgi:diketogulonate reductase-like aldo/keto reductase
LIHWPNPDVPLEETLSAMAKAVDDGLIKYVGVSNFNKRLLEEAVNKSRVPIVCDQVLYNVEEREPEKDDLLDFCQKEGITLVAYSPLNRGILGDKTKELLEKISKKYGATVYQIMLAWLISKDNVVAIPKAGNIKHLKENLEALKIKLSKDDLELINGLK